MSDTLDISYEPLAPDSKFRTHAVFSEVRRNCPVHRYETSPEFRAEQAANDRVIEPTTEFWSVLRYDDCVEVLQSPEAFSNLFGPGPEWRVRATPDGMLLVADAPAHRRQRQIANKGFLPKVVEARKPQIQAAVDCLIDDLGPRGRADVMGDLAVPLTVAMITDFFGAGRDRRNDVARWGQAIVAATGGDRAAAQAGAVAIGELSAMVSEIITMRRRALGAGEELPADVLSALITAEDDDEGSRFNDQEICLAAVQFLTAGFETTATAIGNAVYLLCTHPGERSKLENDWSLLDTAVEEILRFESPIEGTFRSTKCPVVIGGHPIPEKAKVRVVYASANRDERRFPDADRFTIDRPATEVRRHIAFGSGMHTCIGSALARAELRIALRTLLTRLPGLALDPANPPERNTSYLINGFSSVPVVWDPGKARPRST